jgi:hypothetical protein
MVALTDADALPAISHAPALVQAELMPLFRDLFLEVNPIPVKAALALMASVQATRSASPLTKITEKNRAILERHAPRARGCCSVVDVVVCGAAGRMGRMIVGLAAESPDTRVVGAIESPGHSAIGQDAGALAGTAPIGIPVTHALSAVLPPGADRDRLHVPAATLAHAEAAAAGGAGLVIGTTGFTPDEDRELRRVAAGTRAVIAANYSVGVTVLLELVAQATKLLGPGFDAEIVELHHHHKKDGPQRHGPRARPLPSPPRAARTSIA